MGYNRNGCCGGHYYRLSCDDERYDDFYRNFETLGSSFVSQRTATLFGLTVGIIGIWSGMD